ncbi:low-density lipoprotein receptor-related protein 12-like [Pecten maximus]|uniref:low-density lipoprotein receptor-related protein 12-like n=1 Tax=Pecten maximus TaxID=6579 RepID=UPI001457F14E|nr:low-density lipoprotein receptor-related protein 12-like [Pecten maximus]
MDVKRELCRSIVVLTWITVAIAVDIEYMSASCTTMGSTVTQSRMLESSSALVYNDDMNCVYTASVSDSRYNILVVFSRFDLEEKSSGTCLDYVNVYDGSSVSAQVLNTEPLCGAALPSNLVSTGSQVTIEFVTDSSAVLMGFGIIFTEIYNGSCSSTEYGCSNGFCVKSDLRCNHYSECGDGSDEDSCTTEELYGPGADNTALIVGLTLGVLALVVLGVIVGIFIYRQYRWRRFLKDPLPALKKWNTSSNYPVTRKYYKQGFTNTGYQSIETRSPTSQPYKDFEVDGANLGNSKKEDPLAFTPSEPTEKVLFSRPGTSNV